MTTEELKIRITADTQGVESSVNKVKRSLGSINGKETQAATKGVSNSMKEMRDSIESLKNMTALDMLVDNFENLKNVGHSVSGTFKDIKSNLKVTFSNLIPSAYENGEWKGWNKAFKDFAKDGKVSFASLKTDIAATGSSFKTLFTGIIPAGAVTAIAAIGLVVGAVAALVGSVKNAINVSEKLSNTFFEAHKVGLTSSKYQELTYVLGQVGVEADKLSDFIKSLSAAQNDLRDGSEGMVEAFEALGLSAQEAASMTQEDLFVETISRLQQMEDGIQRTGIAYRIFGEDDAAQVANLLALNNVEMERMINNFYLLGGAASDSAIQKSLELQSALANMRLAWQGISNTIGEAVMPAITAVVNAIAKAIAIVNMFLRALFGMSIVSKGSVSSGVNKASASVGGYTSALREATGAAEKLKRSTMGFDELNIVPSGKSDAGGGGSGGDIGGGGGGGSFEIPEISGMTEDLGLDKWAEKIEKWKGVIQMAVPIAMVTIGLIGGIACLFTGHFIGAVALLGMAGIGIAIGNGNGAWKKLGDGIVKIWNNIKTKAKKFLQDVKKFFQDAWTGIKKGATKLWNDIKQALSKLWDNIVNVAKSIWNGLGKFFTKLWNDIKNGVTTAWNAIKTFFTNTWTGIKTTATTIWNAIAQFFKNTWDSIKTTATNVWTAIKQFFENTWNGLKTSATNIWNAVKQFFSDTWNSIKTTATNLWNGIKSMLETTWNNIKSKAEDLCNKLKKFFSDAWEAIKKVWSVVKDYFLDIWDYIKTTASALCDNVKTFFTNCWNGIKDIWNAVKGYFKDIWDNVKSTASSLTDNVKKFFSDAWAAIKKVWDVVKGYFKDIWDKIKSSASSAVESIKGFFSSAWTSIKSVWSSVTTWFGNIWSGIKSAFSGVADWFGSIFSSAVTKVKNAWSNIKTWFSDVWSGIKSVFTSAGTAISDGITGALKRTFNSFMSGAVGLINKFIRAINSAIGVINKIPGVNISTLSQLSVPQLAKGGIVTGSILANIGERGREAVLPLENNTGWMDVLADRIAARNGGSTRVVLQVDGRELGWATIEQINAITKQTGGLQLVL